ncbi:PhnB protein [Algoriphagus iocasae]|uniref:PhnB protein n=1 Tax=Algoriphagus iocasae TaxID=1836499 RepID=A0A841MVG6_9BACT|nr:nuclear transport factor 2 family protein [Algoriphagus iocasae]MBB6328584.1 PhnB protein [Algoriphagus iocasae]
MKEEILKIRAALTEAIQKKSASKANDFYAEDGVLFLLAPPLQEKIQIGIEGLNDLNIWFDTWEGNIGLESEEVVIQNDRNIAFLHSLEHLFGQRKDGSYTDSWYRETLCFLKINNIWKIVHQHQSFPMYMDGSEKAATNLRP